MATKVRGIVLSGLGKRYGQVSEPDGRATVGSFEDLSAAFAALSKVDEILQTFGIEASCKNLVLELISEANLGSLLV